LKQLAGRGEIFGLAFLDPPYGGPDAVAALTALAELPLLAPGARVVVEHSRRESLPEAYGGLTRLTVRRYGDTQVAFYLMAEPAPQEHD
jgi:16S rRNA G966 N2-methylase RsmD